MNHTKEQLMAALEYQPEAGTFVWLQNRRKVKAGDVAGKTDSHGYRVIVFEGKAYKAHRLVWLFETGAWPKAEIDHINGHRSDNRFSNLRDVSRAINARNQRVAHRTNKTSGLLGVNWHRPKERWRACIRINGRVKFLGYFATAEEGHAAYMEAKAIHHGARCPPGPQGSAEPEVRDRA